MGCCGAPLRGSPWLLLGSGCLGGRGQGAEVSPWPLQGVLLYGPPGTGKTLLARAVAHHTDCTFIRVSGSELVQKFIGEGKTAWGEEAACAGAPARALAVRGGLGIDRRAAAQLSCAWCQGSALPAPRRRPHGAGAVCDGPGTRALHHLHG